MSAKIYVQETVLFLLHKETTTVGEGAVAIAGRKI